MNDQFKALGESAERNKDCYNFDQPTKGTLEIFKAAESVSGYVQEITLECLEFTSLCPVTGQPDFGEILISYMPNEWCVESKSLKLYLMQYRQYGCFHEAIVATICRDLGETMQPINLVVRGNFKARGGIAIKPCSVYTAKR